MTVPEPFQEIELLLPFYVNATLDEGERARVEAALAGSETLRASLAQTVKLAARIKTDSAALTQSDVHEDSQLAETLARIDALPKAQVQPAATQQRPEPKPLSLKARLAFLSPNRWHPAVSLAFAVAVVSQAALLVNWSNDRRTDSSNIATLEKRVNDLEFQLASGPGDIASTGNLVVQLDGNASWGSVEALLVQEGLTIVSGPQDGTLILSSDAKDTALDGVLTRLRASSLVVSADKAA